jgi:hypothetical protein
MAGQVVGGRDVLRLTGNPRDRDAVGADRPLPGGLIYSPIGARPLSIMPSTPSHRDYFPIRGQPVRLPWSAGFRTMPEAESPSRKSVGLATSCTKAWSASSTKARRSARSRSGPRLGSPRTWVIATPRMTRGTPRLRGITGTADTSATGIPLRSISNAIVAPQRLQVPHVAVMITPSTRSRRRSSEISRPNLPACSTEVDTPTVT